MHKSRALASQRTACLCGHCATELEQFCEEVVEHVAMIVGCMPCGKGIIEMIGLGLRGASHCSRYRPAQNANGAKTIKPVSVTHNFRFRCARLDA